MTVSHIAGIDVKDAHPKRIYPEKIILRHIGSRSQLWHLGSRYLQINSGIQTLLHSRPGHYIVGA
jgi:hypothetical protein